MCTCSKFNKNTYRDVKKTTLGMPRPYFFVELPTMFFCSLPGSFFDIWPQGMKTHVFLFSRPAQVPTLVHKTHIYFCYLPRLVECSPQIIYDIGTKILYFQCFVTTDMFLFCKPIFFSGNCRILRDLAFGSVKTRFKVILKKLDLSAHDRLFHVFLPPEGD